MQSWERVHKRCSCRMCCGFCCGSLCCGLSGAIVPAGPQKKAPTKKASCSSGNSEDFLEDQAPQFPHAASAVRSHVPQRSIGSPTGCSHKQGGLSRTASQLSNRGATTTTLRSSEHGATLQSTPSLRSFLTLDTGHSPSSPSLSLQSPMTRSVQSPSSRLGSRDSYRSDLLTTAAYNQTPESPLEDLESHEIVGPPEITVFDFVKPR